MGPNSTDMDYARQSRARPCSADYLPKSERELVVWLEAFAQKLPAYAPHFALTDADVEAVRADTPEPGELILLTPAGERLTQPLVRELATRKRLLLLCGRYEGFDERIRVGLKPREISVGDFVCNGGEVPAMLVIDTVIRLIPGVLGDEESATDESHSEEGRLEYPQYTRPREFRGMSVPDVLLSGDHGAVAEWRKQQSELRSRGRRPDEKRETET